MTSPSYGVIVGRFQVPELHAGHLSLFKTVHERHSRVIVFVGVAPGGPTRYNPLDFETRRLMIQALFPTFIVLPLHDRRNDEEWSRMLDKAIRSIVSWGEVTLYGGRDSFVPHYKGEFQPKELVLDKSPSGTEIRNQITNQIQETPAFRAGVIYAVNNRRPIVYPTVDIGIIHDDGAEFWILLGKKSNQVGWRFPGGFVELDKNPLEADAKREAYEETNLSLDSLEYLGSAYVNDWRYADTNDAGIKSTFFVGWSMSKGGKAGDDLAAIEWFKAKNLSGEAFVREHIVFYDLLEKYLERRKHF